MSANSKRLCPTFESEIQHSVAMSATYKQLWPTFIKWSLSHTHTPCGSTGLYTMGDG